MWGKGGQYNFPGVVGLFRVMDTLLNFTVHVCCRTGSSPTYPTADELPDRPPGGPGQGVASHHPLPRAHDVVLYRAGRAARGGVDCARVARLLKKCSASGGERSDSRVAMIIIIDRGSPNERARMIIAPKSFGAQKLVLYQVNCHICGTRHLKEKNIISRLKGPVIKSYGCAI